MENNIDIIRLAIQKNDDAFIRISDSLKNELYHTAYIILNEEADALDALDETMYNAWRGIHKLREPRYFKTWITRILINQCNKILRRRRRETAYENIEELSHEYFDSLPIREAVQKLPSELRIIISLRYFSDMTVPETAEMLSIPQGTVKSRQRKALSLLRLELGDELYEQK